MRTRNDKGKGTPPGPAGERQHVGVCAAWACEKKVVHCSQTLNALSLAFVSLSHKLSLFRSEVVNPSLSSEAGWIGLVGWVCPLIVSCFVVSVKVWRAVLTLVHLVEAVAAILLVDTVDLIENLLLDGLKDYYSVEGTETTESVRKVYRVFSRREDTLWINSLNGGRGAASVLVSASSSAGRGAVMALCLTSDMVDVLLVVVKGRGW